LWINKHFFFLFLFISPRLRRGLFYFSSVSRKTYKYFSTIAHLCAKHHFRFFHLAQVTKSRDNDTIQKFSQRLLSLRKENHLTQKQVADEAGMKVTHYRRIEKAQVNPGLSHIKSLARVYEKSLPEMLDYDTHDENQIH